MSRIAFTGAVRQREPRIRDKAYLGFVAKIGCVACLCRGVRTWPVEVCHVKVGFPAAGWRAFGHAERSHDNRCVPLCAEDHRTGPRAQHANPGGDERTYWRNLGIYPPDFCAALYGAYEAGLPGGPVIRQAAAGGFPWPEDA